MFSAKLHIHHLYDYKCFEELLFSLPSSSLCLLHLSEVSKIAKSYTKCLSKLPGLVRATSHAEDSDAFKKGKEVG